MLVAAHRGRDEPVLGELGPEPLGEVATRVISGWMKIASHASCSLPASSMRTPDPWRSTRSTGAATRARPRALQGPAVLLLLELEVADDGHPVGHRREEQRLVRGPRVVAITATRRSRTSQPWQ